MKLSSILSTFVLGAAALFSVAPADAKLTEGITAYDAMTVYLRRDMNALAHATLETKNPEMIGALESFVTTVESSLQATKMDFDTYRAMRKAVYDKYTTIVSSSRVNDLVKRVDALTNNDAALNDLSLALYAPAAASDFFFDVAEAIANSIDAKEFQQLVKDERKFVERKVNEKANPAWVAAYLHGVLDDIRDLNETYALQVENTQGSVVDEMEKKFGDPDLSSSTKTLQ